MLRLVPPGWLGVGVGVVGVGVGVVGLGAGVVGVGWVGEQLPLDTLRPVPAPAVCRTTSGTQDAPSMLYAYGMLTLVLDTGFGPAGLFSLPGADHVTLSKTLPLT